RQRLPPPPPRPYDRRGGPGADDRGADRRPVGDALHLRRQDHLDGTAARHARPVGTRPDGRQRRGPSTLTTLPSGARTKNRRTPHSSSCNGWTISAPLSRITAYAASTSSTSTLMSGVTGAVRSAVMMLTWAAGTAGEASVTIQPRSITSSKPSRP